MNRHDTSGKFGIISLKYDTSSPVLLSETPCHTWKPQKSFPFFVLFSEQTAVALIGGPASSTMNNENIKYKSKDVGHRPSLNWKYEKGGHQHPERIQVF